MQVAEALSSRTFFIVLGLSIAVNVFLLYRLFNTAISLDHCRSEQTFLQKRTAGALAVIDDMSDGTPKEEVVSIGKALSKQGVIVKEYPSEVQIGDIVFSFKEGEVSTVDYIK